MFKCERCQNEDIRYIGYKQNQPYCRKCIRLTQKNFNPIYYEKPSYQIHANLDYRLTKTQQNASNQILNYVKLKQDVLVNAVCGAGKTELMYQSIEFIINQGGKVAFCIPRKDVVIEIYHRLIKDYPKLAIIAVYGKHTQVLDGQLIVLTAYQLYRYQQHFDLLILDEADAFPYYDQHFLKRSTKGPIIYLSATFNQNFLKQVPNHIDVNRRFHNVDLPIPKIIKTLPLFQTSKLKQWMLEFKKAKQQVLIFVPTISIGMQLSKKLSIPFVYASKTEKQTFISLFKTRQLDILITTTILERGITIDNVQVIVYDSQHPMFDLKTLIQISGRVGRKAKHPTGNIIFLCTKITNEMKACIKELKSKNNNSV